MLKQLYQYIEKDEYNYEMLKTLSIMYNYMPSDVYNALTKKYVNYHNKYMHIYLKQNEQYITTFVR